MSPLPAASSSSSGVRITAIRISQHRFDLPEPFLPAWDTRPRHQFEAVVVQVETDAGVTGIGSGDLMVGFAGHEDLFIGQDPLAIERHWKVLHRIDFHYGRCWPLDLALWDLAGRLTGQPVWKLVGGRSDRIRAYASSGVLRGPEQMADAAEAYLARGFGAMKIRFHRGDWRDDIRALEAVRARVGDRLDLMVDCNQGWQMPWDIKDPWTCKQALQVARELERLKVFWMEEPLHRHDFKNMRRLREMVDIRIAGGEMTRDPSLLEMLLTEGAVDVAQPDAALVGGITGLKRFAAMAEAAGVLFTPHTWTNGLGVLANVHLTAGCAAADLIELPYDPPQWDERGRDFMMDRPLVPDGEGMLVLSDAPGFGVELNHDLLERTRIG